MIIFELQSLIKLKLLNVICISTIENRQGRANIAVLRYNFRAIIGVSIDTQGNSSIKR